MNRRSIHRLLCAAALLLLATVPLVSATLSGPASPTTPNSLSRGVLDVGAGEGAAPQVLVFESRTLVDQGNFLAFNAQFTGGVRVASGDVTGDGAPDGIVGSGAGITTTFKVYEARTLRLIHTVTPFGGFTGGIFVAAGDIDGNGISDIIVGADAGGTPHVKAYDGTTLAELRSFYAFDPSFSGGVRVGSGDVNGDGRADIIVGTGAGTVANVRVFDGATGASIRNFIPFVGFTGGIFVAGGDINNDGSSDIIVGGDSGAASGHVKVFDGRTSTEIRSFFAFPSSFSGGVRVGSVDANGDDWDDIIVGSGPGIATTVKVFDGQSLAVLHNVLPFGSASTKGAYVAGGAVPIDTSWLPRISR